ncbi:hypothetical protein B9Z55_015806 [Caenorhabditis nigoni]|uniref:MADF domain-containing protein n=1 Tax=Caenorhabditis nigoni TaxID=1611254 RepID=A0A2G5UBU3_9PELO|nr:hypothetical protein B9Z55_015806 [Caenorhabditis nigoni]
MIFLKIFLYVIFAGIPKLLHHQYCGINQTWDVLSKPKTAFPSNTTYEQMNKTFDKASEIWRIKMVEFNEQRRIARQKYVSSNKIGSWILFDFISGKGAGKRIRSLRFAIQARNAQEAAEERASAVTPVSFLKSLSHLSKEYPQ